MSRPPSRSDSLVEAALRVLLQPDPWLKAQYTYQAIDLWTSGVISTVCPAEGLHMQVPSRPQRADDKVKTDGNKQLSWTNTHMYHFKRWHRLLTACSILLCILTCMSLQNGAVIAIRSSSWLQVMRQSAAKVELWHLDRQCSTAWCTLKTGPLTYPGTS